MVALARLLGRIYLLLRTPVRWARRRLAPAGWALLVGMAATAATGNPDQTMGMALFFVLAAMLATGLLLAPLFRPRFAVERTPPRLVTAGQPFAVRARVRNLGRRPLRGVEYREALHEAPPTLAEVVHRLRQGWRRNAPRGPSQAGARATAAALPDIPPGAEAEVETRITAFRRGALVMDGGELARCDPFGAVRALQRSSAPCTVLVMPSRHPLTRPRLPGGAQLQQGGVALASRVGESEEFTALRDYRRGDPLRRVHWRSTARSGRMVVKEYQDEHITRHGLVLDTACPPGREDLFEEAVAVAASFACTVPDQDSLLDLLLIDGRAVCITSGRGVGHAQQMLEALATVRPGAAELAPLAALIDRHRTVLSGCVLVLLDWDAPRRDLVRRLERQGLPLLVLVLAPRGWALPEPEDGWRPSWLVVLEEGRVAEGLAGLERHA